MENKYYLQDSYSYALGTNNHSITCQRNYDSTSTSSEDLLTYQSTFTNNVYYFKGIKYKISRKTAICIC